jgi:regulator of sigma E protease
MTTFISFVIVLGVLIFIHELGHFLVAKFSGVGVEKFSLGFGPRIVGFTRGETEYRISLLPLGGYVKMVGESTGEEISEEDKRRSFSHKPVSVRAAIVAAGPAMNLVLAAVLIPVIFMIGMNIPAFLEKPSVIGYVVPGEPAYEAGLRPGDLIESVDGKETPKWEDLLAALALNPGKTIEIDARRASELVKTQITPGTSEDTGAGYGGMYPPMPAVISEVSPGYPAADAGLKPGDTILAVDGHSISHWAELEELIHKSGGKKTFLIGRGEETLTFEITPKYNEEAKVHLVGISRKDEQVLRRYGFFESIEKGLSTAADMTVKLFVVLKGLVVGKYSLKTLGGPIMIAQVAGKAAATGLSELLYLVAFLSLQLGIINLFPIPVLDGGHILFFGIEAAKGRPLSEKFMTIAQQIGVVLLIGLMVLVTYNDLFRIFGG